MELILSFAAGLLLAAVIAFFIIRLKVEAATSRIQAEYDSYRIHTEQMAAERDKRDAEAKTERERQEAQAKAEREEQQKQQMELMKAQFEASSQKLLKERQEELGKANKESVGQLIDPIREQMKEVCKLMDTTRRENGEKTSSLEGALKVMMEKTSQISQEANNLADALKNRGKVHGDWGEQVLADILSGSGLIAGEEFSCQESFKGAKGNELRPDVVINCADGRRIIVDSKVSLTAYSDALGAETEIERQEAVKRNCDSVKKHVKELAEKQYPKYVEGSLNYVLMFIPNEGAYVMAMNHDHALAQEAFRQGVVIVNPTNLMLSLNLVLQTWQQTRQEDNCRKILEAAEGIHDKVQVLMDTVDDMDNYLRKLDELQAKAKVQLHTGKGNLKGRVEALRGLGVTSTRRTKKRKAVTADEDGSTALSEAEETIE